MTKMVKVGKAVVAGLVCWILIVGASLVVGVGCVVFMRPELASAYLEWAVTPSLGTFALSWLPIIAAMVTAYFEIAPGAWMISGWLKEDASEKIGRLTIGACLGVVIGVFFWFQSYLTIEYLFSDWVRRLYPEWWGRVVAKIAGVLGFVGGVYLVFEQGPGVFGYSVKKKSTDMNRDER